MIIALNSTLTFFGNIVRNKNCNLQFEVNLNEKQDFYYYCSQTSHLKSVKEQHNVVEFLLRHSDVQFSTFIILVNKRIFYRSTFHQTCTRLQEFVSIKMCKTYP